eukprot:6149292-Alexandrium_andersonii.AAC.1
MSASLVGSEMCIRDSSTSTAPEPARSKGEPVRTAGRHRAAEVAPPGAPPRVGTEAERAQRSR